ncbi:MAG: FAD-dependent oxidoreductase, partial [Planctomycetes bacterium]|nr:FAD-dependent oxidoreductase [Planctomycetota bacterium]
MHDVIIIGGGVIGLSLACDLAGQGVRVAVLEKGLIGRESSWAGAGILPPGCFARARTPEARLRGASHELWPAFSAQLREETGIDNGYRRDGGLEVRLGGTPGALDAEIEQFQSEGLTVERLDAAGLLATEPALSTEISSA